jgi:Fe(3+) dicitrate transport protein
MKVRLLALAVATALSTPAWSDAADVARKAPTKLDRQEVNAEAQADPRFPQIAKEIEEGKVLTGKKSTIVVLDDQPDVVNNELRQTFVRVPGLLLSEQQIPGHFNINYRGLGDPHESEFVSFFENGVPLGSDWFGYSTMYYMPPIERIERIAFIRGGSSLLYGPQPGPSVDFITRVPEAGSDFALRSRHTFGEDGLYATYNEVSGGTDSFGWQVALDKRKFDGTRENADVDVDGASVSFFWRQSDAATWRFDYYSYDSDNGEAGRLPSAVYATQPNWTSTPFNRIVIERNSGTLGFTYTFSDATELNAKLWHATQDRFSDRTTPLFLPNQLTPNIRANKDRQEFANTGLDARITHDWGSNHTLTFGLTHYVDDSPRSQLSIPQVAILPTLSYRQERDTNYTAAFAESVFRFDNWSLIPAARFESLEYDIFEPEVRSDIHRAPIDRSFKQTVPLFGLGATYDWAQQQLQAYGNISQGYRPMRFDDVANPTAQLSLNNDPDVSDALNIELGLRGSPITGLFFDVSLFRIDLKDKIETQIVPDSNDVLRVNSGDSRHQGIELAGEYDFFAGTGDSHLTVFGSASFLDAEITRSRTTTLVGNTPAYAPDHVFKAGLIYLNGDWLKLALTGTAVDEHFWQDSNHAGGSGVNVIAAVIPSYQVFDLSAEWSINRNFKLLGGVNNLFDEQYYSRVRSDGIEPAAERTPYLGLEVGF